MKQIFRDEMCWQVDNFPWLAHFPDVTPLNVFLWGYVKGYVYSAFVDDIAALHTRVIERIRSVANGIWTRTSAVKLTVHLIMVT
jgi:hypothetical protein